MHEIQQIMGKGLTQPKNPWDLQIKYIILQFWLLKELNDVQRESLQRGKTTCIFFNHLKKWLADIYIYMLYVYIIIAG